MNVPNSKYTPTSSKEEEEEDRRTVYLFSPQVNCLHHFCYFGVVVEEE
jgi:hypothetical protein